MHAYAPVRAQVLLRSAFKAVDEKLNKEKTRLAFRSRWERPEKEDLEAASSSSSSSAAAAAPVHAAAASAEQKSASPSSSSAAPASGPRLKVSLSNLITTNWMKPPRVQLQAFLTRTGACAVCAVCAVSLVVCLPVCLYACMPLPAWWHVCLSASERACV